MLAVYCHLRDVAISRKSLEITRLGLLQFVRPIWRGLTTALPATLMALVNGDGPSPPQLANRVACCLVGTRVSSMYMQTSPHATQFTCTSRTHSDNRQEKHITRSAIYEWYSGYAPFPGLIRGDFNATTSDSERLNCRSDTTDSEAFIDWINNVPLMDLGFRGTPTLGQTDLDMLDLTVSLPLRNG